MLNTFTLDEEDTLLLIVDIQERLAPAMDYKENVVKNTKILMDASELLDLPMILTEQYPQGLGFTVEELTEGRKFHQKIEKTKFSAYTSELSAELEKLGKKNIVLAGMETHICVFQTVRDLVKNGYQVHVASDAVTSRTQENYLNGLDLIKRMGAVCSNTETILFDLLQDANRAEFKAISNLIK